MKARILVIDDNPSNLDLMLYLLKAFGYDATPARDGEAGWHAAQTDRYDLILSDILMPGIDGYELALRVSTLAEPPPIIAVTALAMRGDRERMIDAGFSDYLAKPIDPTAFQRQIEHFLTLGNLRGNRPSR